MIDSPGLTVLIPHRNAGLLLLEAVASIEALALPFDHEVLVIDDASNDEASLDALERLTRKPRIRLLRLATHEGAQAARNRGLDAARHPYVLPLDADDRLLAPASGKSFPELAIEELGQDPTLAFVHTASCMFGLFSGLTISSYPCSEQLVLAKHHVPTSIVFRRQDALAGGGYDDAIEKWQDWSFAVALLAGRFHRRLNSRIAYVRGPGHGYRVHPATTRLSAQPVSEMEQTRATVAHHTAYFKARLGQENSVDEIARGILSRKPTRLEDLLHMAAFDLEQALAVARQRDGSLIGIHDELDIP